MKIKPSRQPGHVVFDVGPSDVSLLESMTDEPNIVSTVVEQGRIFQAQLNERANKRTRLMDEILSRAEVLVSLELRKAKSGEVRASTTEIVAGKGKLEA